MSIGSDLLRYSNRKLILFDLETQRVNTMTDNLPFQLAFIIADRWKIFSRHNYYIHWPDFKMSKDAARITRFDPAWVANGDDPEMVLDMFEQYAYDPDYLIVGHSILGFDMLIHQLWREALGRKRDYSYKWRLIDTHLLARGFLMGDKPDRDNFLAWQYKEANNPKKGVKTGLAHMAKELGVEVDETKTHDAGYDLEVNYGVYKALIQKVEI